MFNVKCNIQIAMFLLFLFILICKQNYSLFIFMMEDIKHSLLGYFVHY